MDVANMWAIDIIGPALLLIVLVWLVVRTRSNSNRRDKQRTEQGTSDVYRDEEQRRRDGTDGL